MESGPERAGRERAERFRLDHQLGIAPIDDMAAILDEAGLDVVVMDVPSGSAEAGLTMHDPETGQTVIAIATMAWSGRQRFTMAHELCHHLKGEHLSVHAVQGHRTPGELEADSFARHLLVPLAAAQAARVQFPTSVESQLNDLVRRFDVSPSVARLQLANTGTPPAALESTAGITAKRLAASHGWLGLWRQRSTLALQPQAPRRLLTRLAVAHRDGFVPLAELADWSNTSRDEFRAVLAETEVESPE